MSTLYILQLEHGKYYVGKTDDISKRYSEHKSGRGSVWTSLHKPVKMLETRQIKSPEDETNVTKELMKKYGIDNVRGGAYCQCDLPNYVKQTLELEQRGSSDACFKCGNYGHFAKDCFVEEESEEEVVWVTTCCGKEFTREILAIQHERRCTTIQTKARNCCYRCGRHGHYADDCYASYHIKGYEIDD